MPMASSLRLLKLCPFLKGQAWHCLASLCNSNLKRKELMKAYPAPTASLTVGAIEAPSLILNRTNSSEVFFIRHIRIYIGLSQLHYCISLIAVLLCGYRSCLGRYVSSRFEICFFGFKLGYFFPLCRCFTSKLQTQAATCRGERFEDDNGAQWCSDSVQGAWQRRGYLRDHPRCKLIHWLYRPGS